MDRRDFLRHTAAGAATLSGRARAQGSRRPNILLLIADQWRGQALESADDPNLLVPNLTRLASEGLQLARTYTANPAGSPSRAAILTGKLPHMCDVTRDNVRLPVEQTTIAEVLSGAGYTTGYIGKWHLDGPDDPGFVPPGGRRQGFEHWAAFNRGHRYFNGSYFRDEERPV
ncbi:MAG: sulfatase-like hydrolase/transferase, partial [bacterium]|nr:sulfatase-like hydrolase/transferase [bacterium]